MRTPHSPRIHAARVLGLATLLFVGSALVSFAAAETTRGSAHAAAVHADSVPRHPLDSVRKSPGYLRPVDPESMSVVLGRRTNAPKVNSNFHGGARSLDDLGRTLCRVITYHRVDTLEKLCVRSDEFRNILWREFPQSRPATGLQWQDAWFFTLTRNRKGCGDAMRDYGGANYELVGIKADSTMRYRNFRMYSRILITVVHDGSDTLRWNWVKAVVERRGRFKLLSLRD